METGVWLSYDLGVQGDYPHLYEWLDDRHAMECGNSMAYFRFTSSSKEKLLEELQADLEEHVALSPQNRIYVVSMKEDGSFAGRFIVGRRKASPWEGYSHRTAETIDE